MPRGVNAYDEARLQRRLWTPSNNPLATQSLYVASAGIQLSTGVESWTDVIRGVTISQSTGTQQPAYNSQRQTLVFDGDDHLTNASVPAYLSGNETTTLIAAVRTTDAGTSSRYIGGVFAPENGAAGQAVYIDTSDGTTSDLTMRFGNGRVESSTAINDGKSHIVFVTYKTNHGSTTVTIDGVGRTISASSPSATLNFSGTHRFVVGNIFFGGVFNVGFSGEIDVFGYYDGEPPAYWRQRFEGWYAWWRASVGDLTALDLMPASNPFRNRPPLIGD